MNEETQAATEAVVKEPSMFDSPEWTGEAAEPAQRRGEPLVGIRFQPVGKVYHYNASGFDDLKVGAWVVVDTARGRQMGQVATLKGPRAHGGPYKRIERLANNRDKATRHYYEQKEIEAMIACRAENDKTALPIKIVRAEYAFDGQTITFLFSADTEDRIETATLRDRMSHLYRARIEFRQISPREVAKILGGIGACGIEERCCSKFLTEFSPISIKHAKEQNLSLNPNDITGMCGRLRCCLVYEFEQYVEAKSRLPKLKSMIGTPSGAGKVVELLHLRDSVKVKIGEGMEARMIIYHREQLTPLEELQRLQEKALNGTCDRHEGGGCDCGRKGSKTGAPATTDRAAAGAPQTGDAETNSGDAEREAARAASIKARQDRIKERNEIKQKRRDEQRKQQKLKARLRREAGPGETPAPLEQGLAETTPVTDADATAGEAGESATPDTPERRERRERRRRGREERRTRPSSQTQGPAQAQDRPQGQQPRTQRPDANAQPRAEGAGQQRSTPNGDANRDRNRRRNRKPLMRRRGEGGSGTADGGTADTGSSGE
jgi:cell fate regulator YaaT (PSP1 superfamily)